jgi:hypothetical protein
VPEADLELCTSPLPIKSLLIDTFFLQCNANGGYVPNPSLDRVLCLQKLGDDVSAALQRRIRSCMKTVKQTQPSK